MVNREAGRILKPFGQVYREGTVAGLTDSQLLERYASRGDDAAFEALMTRYGPMVLGVCRRRLRDGHAAEDAFQATFLVLVRKAGSIRVGRSIGPWIHGVAWRVAERARAEASRRRELTSVGIETAESRVDSEVTRRELADVIDSELVRLPEKYRVPIVLCHLEGLTHEEAAQRLGCPTGTVSIRLKRAQDRLKDRLVRRGSSPSTLALVQALGAGEMAGPVVPASLFEDTLRFTIGKGAIPSVVGELTRGALQAMMRSKIRKAAVGLASLGVIASLATLAYAYLADDPKPPTSIVGKVVDDQGRPVPGADVWLPSPDVGVRSNHVVTDAVGRYKLPISEDLTKSGIAASREAVWVFAPGHSIGTGGLYQILTGADTSEVVVRLGPATDTSFTILGPDNRPIVGARVDPYYIQAPNTAYEFPPKEMLASIGGVTDAQGRVRLPSIERKGFGKVAVETREYGKQLLRLVDRSDEPAERTVRLRPVGRVEGQVIAEKPELARGINLYLSTEEEQHLGGWVAEGEAHVVTDEQGKFSAPALASGVMRISGSVDESLPFRLNLPDSDLVRVGDLTRLDILLKPAVKVRGVVRSRDTKAPLAKATISVGYGTWRQSEAVTTGADGKFEAFVLPGHVKLHVIITPQGYIQLGEPWAEPFPVPAETNPFDLPPIELVKAGPVIPGKLVDSRDRPVSGVQVIASSGNRRYGFAKTDAAGSFKFEDIPPGLELSYEAWSDDETSVPAEVVRTGPLILRVKFKAEAIKDAGGQAAISARVVDREGKPVANAQLFLIETISQPDGQYRGGRRWYRMGMTNTEGWCRKPEGLTPGTSYQVIVQPGNVGVVASKIIRAEGGASITFPPIVADRLGEIAGRVEDRQGRPIAGATVRNWGNAAPFSTTTSDGNGSFRLGGMPEGEVFVFAEAPGFRFGGIIVPTAHGPARLVLARVDEAPNRVLTRSEPEIPRPEASALALKLLAPDIDRIQAGGDREAHARLLEVLARIDPQAAWEKIRTGEKTWSSDAARISTFHALLKSNPEAARSAQALIKTPYYRIRGFEELFDVLPADQIPAKKELLDLALAETRKLDDGGLRAGFMAHFARRLADLGELETARKVVDEALPPAKQSDIAIGRPATTEALASVLGKLDPAAAEALIAGAGGQERDRNDMIGAVAEGVAAIDPARSERLFGTYTHQSSEVFMVHACRRMAGVDLPRARRLAASIKSESLRGYAFGLMADALATANPPVANGLLDDSARAFGDSVVKGQGGVWSARGAATMAASLLPVVERVRPDRLDEFVWRAVSLRWHPRGFNDLVMTIPDTSQTDFMNHSAAFSLHLDRYDRDLARMVIAPAVKGFLDLRDGTNVDFLEWRLILMALSQVDPGRAYQAASQTPDARESGDQSIRDSARQAVAKSLVEDLDQVIAEARMRIIDLEILLREDR